MTSIADLNDLSQICRICLTRDVNLISLYSNIKIDSVNETIVTLKDIIMKLTEMGATDEESFPSNICDICKHLLESAYEFRVKYEHSSTLLQQHFMDIKSLKIEIDVDMDEQNIEYDEHEPGIYEKEMATEKQVEVCEIKQTNEFLIPCPVCTIELPALELRKHVHTHKALKKYLSIPKVPPNTRFYAVKRSTESIFNRVKIKHKCPSCNEEFAAEDFRIHVDNHRKLDEFKCDKCDRIFKKINHFNTHKKKHLKEHPYRCYECGKGFVIKRNYDCHVLTHKNIKLPHVCSFCEKRFSNPEHLHRHLVIHTENITYAVKYKVFRCGRCLQSFSQQNEMKGHKCLSVKKEDGEYPCESCGKVYTNNGALYNHIRRCHRDKNVKDLCTVCGSYVTNLNIHMQRHTGVKPHKCPECSKQFASKAVLRQHLLVHSGLKPFVCSVCGKTFNNLYNLQVHERIHTGNRCHLCTVCHKGFLEKSYLRKHMKIHTNIVK